MIQLLAKGGDIGMGILENGNPAVFTFDRASQIQVTLEFEPEAWRRFLEQAPRLKGVGIAGLAPIVAPADGNLG